MASITEILWRLLTGSSTKKALKKFRAIALQVGQLEAKFAAMDDDQIKQWAIEQRQAWKEGSSSLSYEELSQQVFAAAREVSKRQLNMRHYDVQMVGALVLDHGGIAEMKTGEGKTLVATLALIINAMINQKAFLVTVNDYLASRDAEWMRPLFEGLGLTVGIIQGGLNLEQRKAAYECDIIYATNNELGFDFLRDRMAFSKEDQIQPALDFAIVDEVDSILIDEARTPLIISAPVQQDTEVFTRIDKIIPKLDRQIIEIDENSLDIDESARGDYWVDEKNKQVDLTENGHAKVEDYLVKLGIMPAGESLYEPSHLQLLHFVNACLRAHCLYRKDVEYVVKEGEIILIDENTGRLMPGRRIGSGIHQAIESKEQVVIKEESQTMASTTFQNFFKLFTKLSGMTGTAMTEATEFQEIYGLRVIEIPTNKPMVRIDANDVVFMTEEEKYEAIIDEVIMVHKEGIPVLVGTASVESSELLSKMLKRKKVNHEVLNAKNHGREAEIISQAGAPGRVTISTNMAGRGTDIVLGGNPQLELDKLDPSKHKAINDRYAEQQAKVLEKGGLYVLGCERHESRRIDNQLRGRSGRQGDPGLTRFFLSMEDNLIRLFASDRIRNMMLGLGIEQGDSIEHKMLSNAIERAQKKVEARNFEIRKTLLEYDNIANEQRTIIYEMRDSLLHEESVTEQIDGDMINLISSQVEMIQSTKESEQEAKKEIEQWAQSELGLDSASQILADSSLDQIDVKLYEATRKQYQDKFNQDPELQEKIERYMTLQVLDRAWREQLTAMEHLRGSINLRAYAQRNPKQEYKRESFELFQTMVQRIKEETVQLLFKIKFEQEAEAKLSAAQDRQAIEARSRMQAKHPSSESASTPMRRPTAKVTARVETQVRDVPKVGRNNPCPCGSGRKYKSCYGTASCGLNSSGNNVS